LKRAYVEAEFPELPVPQMHKSARGTGGNARIATCRAIAELFRLTKGKRISTMKLSIAITTVVDS
jgi:hypothetical protein